MNEPRTTATQLMHWLYNGARAVDVIEAALELGLFERLDRGPVTLGALSDELGLVPGRLYKFLDCLECLGWLDLDEPTDDIRDATYRSREPLAESARRVFGAGSIERQPEKHSWRELHGRLPAVLRGEHAIAPDAFAWPPRTLSQAAGFEASMAASAGPIAACFVPVIADLLRHRRADEGLRLLDVGGGDGTLGLGLVLRVERLRVDVYNLPLTRPLVEHNARTPGAGGRLGFVGGDFLREPLPPGFDAISFVRVLFDWPSAVVKTLLTGAFAALPPGGKLLICEEFRSPDQLAIQLFWMYFLIGVDSNVCRLRERGYYTRALEEVGFREITVIPGPFEIVVATRP